MEDIRISGGNAINNTRYTNGPYSYERKQCLDVVAGPTGVVTNNGPSWRPGGSLYLVSSLNFLYGCNLATKIEEKKN